jgi:hypothetical protein
LINGSTVSIPLKTNADATTFSFILNSGSTNPALVNILKFNYAREELFVSRACGFKTEYTLDPRTPYVLTDAAVGDQKMEYIAVKNSIIANENETHLEIYFSICLVLSLFLAQAQETTTIKKIADST